MAEQQQPKMTVEEFFEWQQSQDRNYELVDGVPVLTVKAMTGATVRHFVARADRTSPSNAASPVIGRWQPPSHG